MDSVDDTNKIIIKEELHNELDLEDFSTHTNTSLGIKDQLQDLTDSSTTIKIEEHGVVKQEITEETSVNAIETVFLPGQPYKKALLCVQCSTVYVDYCLRCPMLLRVLDNIVRKGTNDRAKLTLPKKMLKIEERTGVVFAMQDLPSGVTFGPYEGLKRLGDWYLMDMGKLICTATPENSNWLQYVSYTFTFELANVVSFQCNGFLFFRSSRNILAGEELQLYLTGDLRSSMFKPVTIDHLGETFACMPCCLGFSRKTYLNRHWQVCPHPRAGKQTYDRDVILIATPYARAPSKQVTTKLLGKKPVTPKQPPAKRIEAPTGVCPNVEVSQLSCKLCDRHFPHKRLLKWHKELAHKPIKCEKCHKYLLSKQKLAQHMLTHANKKKKKLYKCNYCDYMSEKKCVDFVLHMIHKYDKKKSIESSEASGVIPAE